MVLVSIFMPSYNHEKFISETIESVLNQTFKDFEFIIVDDCSSDNSREIIKKYKEKDGRIKFIFHNKNTGVSGAYNDGINLAKGKYIAQLDSDDVWNEQKLEKQLKILDKDENLIVWSEGEIIDEKSQTIYKESLKFTEMYDATKKKKSGNIFLELIHGNFIFTSSVILKKEILGDIRFNERYKIINDHLFFLDLAKKNNFYFIKEPLAKYRIHRKNTLKSNINNLIKESFQLKLDVLKRYYFEVPKKIKWFLNSGVIYLYLMYGDRKKARPFIIDAIKNYPQNILNYSYLIRSFIRLKSPDNFLKRLHYRLLDNLNSIYFNKIRTINID